MRLPPSRVHVPVTAPVTAPLAAKVYGSATSGTGTLLHRHHDHRLGRNLDGQLAVGARAGGKRHRLDRVRRLEGVVRIGRGGRQQAALHRLDRLARHVHRHIRILIRIGVHERQIQLAVLGARGRGADLGDAAAVVRVLRIVLERERQRRRILERHVHVVRVVRGRQQHLVLVGQDHRLQHVDHLRDIGHAHAVGMVMEDVEVERRHHRVAQRVLLVQEACIGALLHVVPGAPFVDQEAQFFLGVVAVQDFDVLFDHAVDPEGVRQRGEPFVFLEASRGALHFPFAGRDGVVVEADAVGLLFRFAADGVHPAGVVVVAAAGDDLRAQVLGRAQEGLHVLVQVRVVARRHVAAAAPGLVTDGEKVHLERLVAAILAAQFRQRRLAVGRHVLHPLRHLLRAARAKVTVHVGVRAQLLGQVEELVGAHGVRFLHAAPVGVDLDRTLLARADAVAPVVFVGKAAARPAHQRHVHVLQRAQHVVAPSPRVRDLRLGTDPHAFVDAGAQVLGELAVDVLVDDGARLRGVDGDADGRRPGACACAQAYDGYGILNVVHTGLRLLFFCDDKAAVRLDGDYCLVAGGDAALAETAVVTGVAVGDDLCGAGAGKRQVQRQRLVGFGGVDAGDVPGVAGAARDHRVPARVAVHIAAVVPAARQLAQEGFDHLGRSRHAFRALGKMLDTGQHQHRRGQLEAVARGALDVGDVAEHHGREVHRIEQVAREWQHGHVGGHGVFVLLLETGELEALDRFHRHEVGPGAVPAARDGGTVEVYQQAGSCSVVQDVHVIRHHGLRVAIEKVDFHALDAQVADALELRRALRVREQLVLGRVFRAVPRPRRVIPEDQAHVLFRAVGRQLADLVVADAGIPVDVDQRVIPVHIGRVIDEGLLHVVDDGIVLEQRPAPRCVARPDQLFVEPDGRRGQVGSQRGIGDRGQRAKRNQSPWRGQGACHVGKQAFAAIGFRGHRIANAVAATGRFRRQARGLVGAVHACLRQRQPVFLVRRVGAFPPGLRHRHRLQPRLGRGRKRERGALLDQGFTRQRRFGHDVAERHAVVGHAEHDVHLLLAGVLHRVSLLVGAVRDVAPFTDRHAVCVADGADAGAGGNRQGAGQVSGLPGVSTSLTLMCRSGLVSAGGGAAGVAAGALDAAVTPTASAEIKFFTIVHTNFLGLSRLQAPVIHAGCLSPGRRTVFRHDYPELDPSSVDDVFLRRAHGAVVGGQEQHHRRDILRQQFMGQALIALDVFLARVVEPQVDLALGHHPPRRDGVDADAVGAEFARQSPRQPVRGRLGGRVHGIAGVLDLPRDGADVDDGAIALFLHAMEHGLAGKEHRALIDGDALVPVLDGDVLGGVALVVGGVVDEDVERADGVDHAGHGGLQCGDAGVAGDIDKRHLGALLGERDHHRLADAGAAAGDEYTLAAQAGEPCQLARELLAGQLTVAPAPGFGAAVAQHFRQQRLRQVLVRHRAQEAHDRTGTHRRAAAIGRRRERTAVDHGAGHFHAGRVTIGQDAAYLAFQYRQQLPGGVQIGVVHLQRGGQLAFQAFGNLQQLGHVLARHHQRRRSEDLFAQRVLRQEGRTGGHEQRRGALAFFLRRQRQRGDVGLAFQLFDTALEITGDTGRQHGRRCAAGQRLRRGLGKAVQLRAGQRQHQAGVGAELAHAQRERTGKRGGDLLGAVGQRRRQQEHRIDRAHFGVHGNRHRPRRGNGHQRHAAAARTGEAHGLDGRMAHQLLADGVAGTRQQREHAARQTANFHRFRDRAADQFRGAGMGEVPAQHDRATGGKGGSGVATGNRERQREVTGRENGNRAHADHAHAQFGTRWHAVGQRAVDAHVVPRAFAQQVGEQLQLAHGAAPLTFDTGARQAAFGHRAFHQRVAEFQDLGGDGFQEHGALFVADRAERVECGFRRTARGIDLRVVDREKFGVEQLAGSRVPGAQRRSRALDGLARDECFAGFAFLDHDVVGHAQGGGAEEVDVHIARTVEQRVLEVVVLQVGDGVRHILLAAEERLFPAYLAVHAVDARRAFDMGRRFAHQQRGTQAAHAQLGVGQVQVVLALGHVVRELVADGETDAVRLAVVADHVQARHFRLFTAVEREVRHGQVLAAGGHDRAVALVEPFRLHAGGAGRRFAAFHAHAEHFHRVAQGLHVAADFLVHGVAGVGAAQVSEASAGDVGVGVVGVIERRQQAAVGGDGGERRRAGADGLVGQGSDAHRFTDRVLREGVGGAVTVDDADGVLFQHADLARALFVAELMRMTWHGRAAVTDQEVEIAAFVGLQHVFDVQLLVAGFRSRRAAGHAHCLALGHFGVRDFQIQFAARAIERDPVAVLDDAQRAAGHGFRRHVQHHGAVRGAAHAGIRNADHVLDASCQQFWRQAHIAHFRHAGIAFRAAVLHHQHRVRIHFQVRIQDARLVVFKILEHHGLAAVLHQRGRGGRRLQYRAARRQVAAQDADAAVFQQRLLQRTYHFLVVDRRILAVFPEGLAVDGERVRVGQQVALAHAADHARQAARIIKLFHQEAARRQQVDDGGHATAHAGPVFQLQVHADTAGNRLQVDHCVGGAADGGVHADCVFEVFLGQDLRQLQIFADHFHDADARHVGQHVAARVHRRNGGVVRQRGAQRFGHAGHGRCGAHGIAGAGGARVARFGGQEFVHRDFAALDLLVQLPDGGAGTDVLAVQFTVEHGAAGDHDGRNVDRRGAHQQRRGGLVAADQQHHAIHRIAADRFLDVHGSEVTGQHGGWAQIGFAVREDGEFDREAARFQDAALDVFGQFAEVGVAGGEFGPGVADADNRFALEFVVRNALIFHPAAVHEAVLVIGAEPFGGAQLNLLVVVLGHANLLSCSCTGAVAVHHAPALMKAY
uniref:Uncharacterized protein n=1 Tax=Tanacetum cinerariifolium TaxID=118510 RepID=A0A699GEX3_TANCI|nr:hypothetical protein [Tanacetum cinerariifolium]